ncbi:hypothetical protein [Accumulibacter sp.]|nr:hypothetical protein [Accumulibacter sp.]
MIETPARRSLINRSAEAATLATARIRDFQLTGAAKLVHPRGGLGGALL